MCVCVRGELRKVYDMCKLGEKLVTIDDVMCLLQ